MVPCLENSHDKVTFQVILARPGIVMTNDLSRQDVHYIESVLECADPQLITGRQDPMDIMIGDAAFRRRRLERSEGLFVHIDLIDTAIFGTDPEIAEPVLTDLMHPVAAERR